jgi:hypothetical protein
MVDNSRIYSNTCRYLVAARKGEHTCETHGGKGIRVCDRWLEPNGKGFQNFLDDFGPRPSHTTLDRVNPQDHYTPLNCRLGTPKE